MAKIKGTEKMTAEELSAELDKGGKFVMYRYTISIFIMTFNRGSNIHFIPSSENGVRKGIPFSIITFLLGWWGIPWGPIRSFQSLKTNFEGGENVTARVLDSVRKPK